MVESILILIYFYPTSVPVEEPGCRADDDCPDNLSCRNRQCISPCKTANPCSNNAICTVVGHQPKCECPEGHTGNPNINCYQSESPILKLSVELGEGVKQLFLKLITRNSIFLAFAAI